jgi:hypothetical protein
MNYYIFIIIGIILYLYLNTKDNFNVGAQYVLTRQGTGLDESDNAIPLVESDPNTILLDMLDKISTDTSVCALDGFGDCELLQHLKGGSCQINSIVGLYRALGVPFQEADRYYINSIGDWLANKTYLEYVYIYLANRKSMRALSVYNNLNPVEPVVSFTLDILVFLSMLKNNALYTVFVEGVGGDAIYLQFDGHFIEAIGYTHNLLMYKTNYTGLQSFVDFVNQTISFDSPEKKINIIGELMNSLTNLSQLSQEVLRNGNVCIMIDLCQKKFYAVTELDYPSTIHLLSDDGSVPAQDSVQFAEYNTLWKLKVNIKFLMKHVRLLLQVYSQVSLIDNTAILSPLDLNNIDSDDSDLLRIHDRWKNSEKFRQVFTLQAVTFLELDDDDYTATNLPLLPPNFFRGHANTLCKVPPPPSAQFEDVAPLCNPMPDNMVCAPKEVNGVMYNICQLDSNHCSVSLNDDDDGGGSL